MRFEILKNGDLIETKTFEEGQFQIGRSEDCAICLKSTKVSKQHALLVIKGSQIAVVDTGSSNGLFVNGVMVKKQRIHLGDIISIGEYQLRPIKDFPKLNHGGSVGRSVDGNLARKTNEEFLANSNSEPNASAAANLQSHQEKFKQVVDKKVLIPLYEMMKLVDWRVLLGSIMMSALVLTVLLAARPLYVWATGLTQSEALERAHTVLNQIVRENYRGLQKGGDFARLSVDPWESVKGFEELYIIDSKTGNIVAPVKLYNKSLNDSYALIALKKVLDEKSPQVTVEHSNGVFIVAQPIPQPAQENLEDLAPGPAAVVLGKFQAAASITSVFEPVLEAIIFAVFLGLFAYYLILKMVTHPVQQIQEQLDAALRGEAVSIASEARLEDFENLAQVINFSVSKLKQSNVDFGKPLESGDHEAEDELYVKTIEEFDVGSSDAVLLLDKEKKVKFVGHVLEELIGLRSQYAQGQNISDCCRDAGFAGTAIDMTDRVVGSLGETQNSTLDINGINRAMVAVGHRSQSGEVRFILLIVKMGGA